MESTVYLNPHFKPNHQSSYYRNDLYEYIEQQKEMNLLILKKLNRQNNFIYNQFYELHQLIKTSQEHYAKFGNEQNKLINSMKSLSNIAKTNERKIEQTAGISKNNNYLIQELIEKLHETSKKVDLIPRKMSYHITNIEDEIALSNKKQEESLKEVYSAIQKAEEEIINRSTAELKELKTNLPTSLKNTVEQIIEPLFTDVGEVIALSNKKQEESLKEVNSAMKKAEEEIINRSTAELNELKINLPISLKNTVEQIIEPLFTGVGEVTKQFESFLEEEGKQPICELFEMLNPGTKINKLVISGAGMQVASFIHYDKVNDQVKFCTEEGNLLIANCKDIEAVEINTKKSNNNQKE